MGFKTKSRGDTIIEVMVGFSIFSMVAVATISLMSDGLAISQRSLETTLVRQQIDSQAEMLRYIHDRGRQEGVGGDFNTLWNEIMVTTNSGSGEPSRLINVDVCPEPTSSTYDRSFAISQSGGSLGIINRSNIVQPATYARVDNIDPATSRSHGISIQLAKVSGGSAYDAYVQACWDAPGLSRPMTIGTIVRLYDANA